MAHNRKALVLGAGGFIGSHMARRLVADGFHVCGVDVKAPEFSASAAQNFIIGDLRDDATVRAIMADGYDEIYQFAANMGGAGFIFTQENDADIMRDSAQINLNVLRHASPERHGRIFWSSSACVYPARNQQDPQNPTCAEATAYPADPDSDYGWEKLFSERLFLAHGRNKRLNVRIARYHNVFGPEGTWTGGREKAPAAVCRKVAVAVDGGSVELWGDGLQTRSFLYIDECIEGTLRLMRSDCDEPLNIGSAEMVSMNQVVEMVAGIAGKRLAIRHVEGPLGVRGRCSDNALIQSRLGWQPTAPLQQGMAKTYAWIEAQVRSAATA